MNVVLAILAGSGLGYIVERGDFCFHSTWRGLISKPQKLDLWRAYLLMLLVAIPLVQGMIAFGWIEPWIPPFAWQASIVGGVIFGIGMVIGATCITGLFYKLGHGMLGTLVGLVAWSIGDIVTYRGFLAPLRNSLNAAQISVNGQSATVTNLLGGVPGWLLLGVLGVATAVYLIRSPRGDRDKLWTWLPLGLATGIFTSFIWLLARAGGSNYTYGTSGVPTGIYQTLIGEGGGGNSWILIALVSLIPGAFIAAKLSGTLWVRGETPRRYAQLAVGGLLMGIGAGIAGGCNLGHSTVGVPLLSLGSITASAAMLLGVFIADRVSKMLG